MQTLIDAPLWNACVNGRLENWGCCRRNNNTMRTIPRIVPVVDVKRLIGRFPARGPFVNQSVPIFYPLFSRVRSFPAELKIFHSERVKRSCYDSVDSFSIVLRFNRKI